MKGLSVIFAFIFSHFVLIGQIVLNEETLGNDMADRAYVLEDPSRSIDLQSIIDTDTFDFEPFTKPLEIIDFTHSRWFIRFEVTNEGPTREILFETARPITDRVDLYEVKNGSVIQTWRSGDQRPFDAKTYPHRKNIFPIKFDAHETKHFYIILESDGEVISLPFVFREQQQFHQVDYRNQLLHGFYYGMLALVIFIFFFFYLLLKEKSFLFYITYVFFQFMLQFSLEGFTFQYLFPENIYLANQSVLLSAGGAVFFVILYASSFLKIKKRSTGWKKFFKAVLIGIIIITSISLIPGITHYLAYPVINLISLVATVSILFAIYDLRRKGYQVNRAFSMGFVFLILGAVIFILGNLGIVGDARISEIALKIGSGLEILALSISMAGKYKELQEQKEKAQEEALKKLESLVEERTEKIKEQKILLEEQHRDMLGSIKYAQRIQEAILPSESHVKRILPESFIYYVPRDIVSGDFYFVESVTTESGEKIDLFAGVDCTGHGVPGAFMSFIGNNYLTQSLKVKSINSPGEALGFLNRGVFKSLKIEEAIEKGVQLRDGMDMTLCGLNRKRNQLYFAGAKNSIIIITDKENIEEWQPHEAFIKITTSDEFPEKILIEVKGDRHPIGLYGELSSTTFTDHVLPIHKGDLIYSYSDGYIDQFGGDKNKKFGTKRFKDTLLNIHDYSMDEQKRLLDEIFSEWKGERSNLDDILVMGVKV
ncbi:MAG: 7TM diverse intracellular signaling domain-containing protein [Brumimicrobium sp.]|nr:7TM diverse intracellular signaling domain-containing protein [Brumimicrobium sp.]